MNLNLCWLGCLISRGQGLEFVSLRLRPVKEDHISILSQLSSMLLRLCLQISEYNSYKAALDASKLAEPTSNIEPMMTMFTTTVVQKKTSKQEACEATGRGQWHWCWYVFINFCVGKMALLQYVTLNLGAMDMWQLKKWKAVLIKCRMSSNESRIVGTNSLT